jgi:serine/threonine protein kinase
MSSKEAPMATSILQPGNRFGGYELLRKLESGGMGEVWKASQVHSEQLVAIKFINLHLLDDPANETRFLNEAKTLARLEHDRIVPLYGVCEDQGRLALVLRFVDGESLARRIAGLAPFPKIWFCPVPATFCRPWAWRTNTESCIATSSRRTS